MTHLEIGMLESRAADKTPFEHWAGQVERLLGFDLDGEQTRDGYSIDFAFATWREGQAPKEYVSNVRSEIASLAKF